MKVNVLILGKDGQLGKSLKKVFPQALFCSRNECDLTSPEHIQNLPWESIDILINAAAFTAVDRAETNEGALLAEKINFRGTELLAELSNQHNVVLVHISTDYVFDGEAFTPYTEEENVNPKSVYGETKLWGEKNCFEENPDTIIIRTSWLYSAYGNNFVKTMLRLGKDRGQLNVVFDQVGTPTYAADLAIAILEIIAISAKNPEKFVPGIYHYSNEGVASWFDFAKAIFEISGVNCNVNPVLSDQFPTAAKRPNFSVLNKLKIKNVFELTIPYWRDSLKICIERLK
jgi:dTDP-4-dehydrorhamnose reductase